MIRSIALFALTAVPTLASANDWKHVSLQSTNATQIQIDYVATSVTNGESGSILAKPAWINVTLPAHSDCNVIINAIVTNFYKSTMVAEGTVDNVQSVRLSSASSTDDGRCRFTAELAPITLSRGYVGYGYNFRQDIAVEVRGTWLTDPITGKNSFSADMGW